MKKQRILKWFERRPLITIICLSLVLNIILEILARRSLIGSLFYIAQSPGNFFFNALIIMMTLSISLFFAHRLFFFTAISVIWVGLGITNCALLGFRTTPFSAADFRLLTTAFDVFDLYLNWWQVALLALAVIAAFTALVFIWKKAPKYKEKTRILRGLATCSIAMLCVFGGNSYIASAAGADFTNLADAYEDYGFAYCFSVSVVDMGISEPEGYSEDAVDQITKSLPKDKEADGTPNIIFLQLESFFDVTYVEGMEFSEDPMPVFRGLKESCTSGLLYVPSVGAGTANTEFEVLTGMSIDYFGTGEYPYKTVLQTETSESLAYSLSGLGYASHAIHNHRGAFYDRDKVYSKLGFDTFTSLEYMQNIEKTEKNWAKDAVLTDEIFGAMESTYGQDFVFAVSVQGHGTYPTNVNNTELTISVDGVEEEDETPIEYYVQQLKEIDEFLGELTRALESYDEDVVLVVYGDHLPSVEAITSAGLEHGSEYTTEYIIWSNFGLEGEDADLEAYQLGAAIQEMLGMNYGIVTKYHQTYSDTFKEDYLEGLRLLEYDMLYGAGYAYGATGAYEATGMTMGYDPITIKSASVEDGKIYVYGAGFTKFSGIYIDGEYAETQYISERLLIAELSDAELFQTVSVGQRDKNRYVLGYSNEILISSIK